MTNPRIKANWTVIDELTQKEVEWQDMLEKCERDGTKPEKYGVSQADLARFRCQEVTLDDLRDMTWEESYQVNAWKNTLNKKVAQGASDVQVGGDHYRKHGNMQVWDIIQEYGGTDGLKVFLRWSVLKYLTRDKTDRLEDDKKALHCLTKLVELEKQPG